MEQNCQLPRNSSGRLLPAIRSPIGEWMNGLEARDPKNVLIVATANKLARIVWAVLSSGEDYRVAPSSVAA